MDENEKAVESLISGLPEEEQKIVRARYEAAAKGEELALLALQRLVASLDGKEHIDVGDLNERQVEWLEEMALHFQPAKELALDVEADQSALRCLHAVLIGTMHPQKLGVAMLAGNSMAISGALALFAVGVADRVAKLAEVARAARTEKAARHASN